MKIQIGQVYLSDKGKVWVIADSSLREWDFLVIEYTHTSKRSKPIARWRKAENLVSLLNKTKLWIGPSK